MKYFILGQASRFLFPVLLVLSLIVLYRGHNLPGGGRQKPRQNIQQGGFTTARRPHDAHVVAAHKVETYPVQHLNRQRTHRVSFADIRKTRNTGHAAVRL